MLYQSSFPPIFSWHSLCPAGERGSALTHSTLLIVFLSNIMLHAGYCGCSAEAGSLPIFQDFEVCVQLPSHVWPPGTPQTIAHQVPLSMGFSRQEYWSGVPFPPPGNLPDPGIEPESLKSPALAGGFFTASATILQFKDEPKESGKS